MFKKLCVSIGMFSVLFLGAVQLTTAGACEDSCQSTYNSERAACYNYPAGWLRDACFVAASNRLNFCLDNCVCETCVPCTTCDHDYNNDVAACYNYPAGWLRDACFVAASNVRNLCYEDCTP